MDKLKVPFADLKPTHTELRAELDNAYKRVVEASNFIQGEECATFEKEFAIYCNVKY